jgi:hypothetical protein
MAARLLSWRKLAAAALESNQLAPPDADDRTSGQSRTEPAALILQSQL